MDYRNLGTCGVKVSPVCLGTAFRGGLDEATCLATIDRALDLGVNFVDCANTYGRGRSEAIVGQALKGKRDRVVLTTKVCSAMGDGPNEAGLSRAHIMHEAEASLTRLQTDYIDLYLAHTVDAATPAEETLRAFDDLVHYGKVRYVGCSNYPAWRVAKSLWVSDRRNLAAFVCVQDHYNLLDRRIERELVPLCQAEGLGIMTYSAVAVGLLTGAFRHGQTPPPGTLWAQSPQRFPQVMTPAADRVVQALADIASQRGKTPAQVAIAWVVSRPGVTAAIIGPDHPSQVDENLGGCGWELEAAEVEALDQASAWAVDAGRIV
jgi:1-deoxyxylulose-5-phosphate synthase